MALCILFLSVQNIMIPDEDVSKSYYNRTNVPTNIYMMTVIYLSTIIQSKCKPCLGNVFVIDLFI